MRPVHGAIGLDINEQNQRLRRVGIEHAIWRPADDRVEGRDGVLPVEELHQRIDVYASQGALWCEGGGCMTDIEIPGVILMVLVDEPDVSFDADTARLQG